MNKKYSLMTGWYPSENTAVRVLSKAKAFNVKARIVEDLNFYGVLVSEFDDLEQARRSKTIFASKGLYCGIVVG